MSKIQVFSMKSYISPEFDLIEIEEESIEVIKVSELREWIEKGKKSVMAFGYTQYKAGIMVGLDSVLAAIDGKAGTVGENSKDEAGSSEGMGTERESN